MKNVLFIICLLVFSLEIWSANVPVLSKNSQTFQERIKVTIALPESCIVCYTTNGKVPTRKDERCYNSSILTFDSSVTLIAKAFRFFPEMSDSSNVRWEDGGVATATYTKILQKPYCDLVFINADSISVALFSRDKDAVLYYATDGSLPGIASKKYIGVFRIHKDVPLKVISIKNGSISSSIWTKE